MLLDVLGDLGVPVFGIGKIHDIYNGRGVGNYVTTKNNADGMTKLREALARETRGLIFANLVDFDMLYGHRKDVEGFARSLEEFDELLGPFARICADTGLQPERCWWRKSWNSFDTGGHGANHREEFRRIDSARLELSAATRWTWRKSRPLVAARSNR